MKHLHKYSKKCKPSNSNEFYAECLFYNSNIKIGNHTVFIKNWMDNGIFLIHHILKDDQTFLNFNEFTTKFVNVNTNFIQYQGIVLAVKRYFRRLNPTLSESFKIETQTFIKILLTGSKSVRLEIDKTELKPPGQTKWDLSYDGLNWYEIYKKCHKTTADCKLKWFQLRIIYRVLPTNRYLFLKKIVDNANCTFCNNEEETIVHLLWSCDIIAPFWEELLQMLLNTCNHIYNMQLSEELILFGVKENIVTDQAFDLIMMLAKYYIYSCKWNNNIPNVPAFRRLLCTRYNVERYRSIINNKLEKFDQLWFQYKRFIEL